MTSLDLFRRLQSIRDRMLDPQKILAEQTKSTAQPQQQQLTLSPQPRTIPIRYPALLQQQVSNLPEPQQKVVSYSQLQQQQQFTQQQLSQQQMKQQTINEHQKQVDDISKGKQDLIQQKMELDFFRERLAIFHKLEQENYQLKTEIQYLKDIVEKKTYEKDLELRSEKEMQLEKQIKELQNSLQVANLTVKAQARQLAQLGVTAMNPVAESFVASKEKKQVIPNQMPFENEQIVQKVTQQQKDQQEVVLQSSQQIEANLQSAQQVAKLDQDVQNDIPVQQKSIKQNIQDNNDNIYTSSSQNQNNQNNQFMQSMAYPVIQEQSKFDQSAKQSADQDLAIKSQSLQKDVKTESMQQMNLQSSVKQNTIEQKQPEKQPEVMQVQEQKKVEVVQMPKEVKIEQPPTVVQSVVLQSQAQEVKSSVVQNTEVKQTDVPPIQDEAKPTQPEATQKDDAKESVKDKEEKKEKGEGKEKHKHHKSKDEKDKKDK